MKKMIAGFFLLALVACVAFGCTSKADTGDPSNKQNILNGGDSAAATSGGAGISGKGFSAGPAIKPPPPPAK